MIILSSVWVWQREKDKKVERWKNFIIIYIICWYSLYYFNKLYVKIETEYQVSCKMRW